MKGKKAVYQPNGWAISSLCEVQILMAIALTEGVTKRIKGMHITQRAAKLDRYFRSGIWWSDRMGMALKYFLNALCNSEPEGAFIELTTVLEALLTTERTEITHMLAERVSVLLHSGSSNGVDTYNLVKDLYKIRSSIVHGKVEPKKGILNRESLFITAKHSNVPMSKLKSLTSLTISVINCVFQEQKLLEIIQTKRSEGATNKALNEFFLMRLFGGLHK
jgi:hypothetical protein